MHLEIITPEETIFKGEIRLIRVPGTQGSFEVLQNHAPLISTLEKGEIKIIEKNDKESRFEINGGMIEVKDNKVIVLSDFS